MINGTATDLLEVAQRTADHPTLASIAVWFFRASTLFFAASGMWFVLFSWFPMRGLILALGLLVLLVGAIVRPEGWASLAGCDDVRVRSFGLMTLIGLALTLIYGWFCGG